MISRLPVRFQGTARKWDSMQSRSFLVDICYNKKIKRKSAMYVKEKLLTVILFFIKKKFYIAK